MSEKSSSSTTGGIGFCGLLTVLFIGLKLTGVIDWAWWAVLLPMWGPLVLILVVVVFATLMALATGQLKDRK